MKRYLTILACVVCIVGISWPADALMSPQKAYYVARQDVFPSSTQSVAQASNQSAQNSASSSNSSGSSSTQSASSPASSGSSGGGQSSGGQSSTVQAGAQAGGSGASGGETIITENSIPEESEAAEEESQACSQEFQAISASPIIFKKKALRKSVIKMTMDNSCAEANLSPGFYNYQMSLQSISLFDKDGKSLDLDPSLSLSRENSSRGVYVSESLTPLVSADKVGVKNLKALRKLFKRSNVHSAQITLNTEGSNIVIPVYKSMKAYRQSESLACSNSSDDTTALEQEAARLISSNPSDRVSLSTARSLLNDAQTILKFKRKLPCYNKEGKAEIKTMIQKNKAALDKLSKMSREL